jgi:hypothetical protein
MKQTHVCPLFLIINCSFKYKHATSSVTILNIHSQQCLAEHKIPGDLDSRWNIFGYRKIKVKFSWKLNTTIKFSQIFIQNQIKIVPLDKVGILKNDILPAALLKKSIFDMQTLSLSTVQFSSKDALDYSGKRTERLWQMTKKKGCYY